MNILGRSWHVSERSKNKKQNLNKTCWVDLGMIILGWSWHEKKQKRIYKKNILT